MLNSLSNHSGRTQRTGNRSTVFSLAGTKEKSIRFGGNEDETCRSAWTSTNKSVSPPSPAQRKSSLIVIEDPLIEDPAIGAPPMEAMDSESSHSESNHSGDDKLTPMVKPSALKHRSKTVPILKMDREENFQYIQEQLPEARSAWNEHKTRKASFGPSPAQRHSTHGELDLAEACAQIQRMAEDSSTSLFGSSTSCRMNSSSTASSNASSKSSSKWWQV